MSDDRKPSQEQLLPLLSRAIELAGAKLAPETLKSVGEVFQVLLWDFVDCGVKAYLIIGDEGQLSFVSQADRAADGTVKIEARALHDMALGRVPVALAFLGGKLRVQGLPALKLRRFIPLLEPFLEGYRQAWQEIREGRSGQVLP